MIGHEHVQKLRFLKPLPKARDSSCETYFKIFMSSIESDFLKRNYFECEALLQKRSLEFKII